MHDSDRFVIEKRRRKTIAVVYKLSMARTYAQNTRIHTYAHTHAHNYKKQVKSF